MYDEVTDSLTLYITGRPVPGVRVLLENDSYVIVDPETKRAIGLYVEAFEKAFVPSNADFQEVWSDVKQTLAPEQGRSQLLRLLALWLTLLFTTAGLHPQTSPQPQTA